jgi:hypothetical protein
MKTGSYRNLIVIAALVILGIILGYLLLSNGNTGTQLISTPEYAPTNVWSSLLEVTPLSYTTPHPNSGSSPLDGTYAKFDPAWPQWWSCLRCADYRPAGGAWRLQFDRGVMRIYYEVTGWSSLASYTVSGDRLYLFNDPYCRDETGEYRWNLEDGNLILEPVQDSCSFQLRSGNLGKQSWEMCDQASGKVPRGCQDPIIGADSVSTPHEEITVTVHQGDVRLFAGQPDIYVNASGADRFLPDGVHISFSDESILYGNNRVLWIDKDWIELVIDGPFESVGVQFRGDHVIGWARVLFDGEEIWQGDTSRIWSDLKIHGGYIEISDFEPGEHIIRVERPTVDSRPVVVAFFGINKQGVVQK